MAAINENLIFVKGKGEGILVHCFAFVRLIQIVLLYLSELRGVAAAQVWCTGQVAVQLYIYGKQNGGAI